MQQGLKELNQVNMQARGRGGAQASGGSSTLGDHKGWQGGVVCYTTCVVVTDNTRVSGKR